MRSSWIGSANGSGEDAETKAYPVPGPVAAHELHLLLHGVDVLQCPGARVDAALNGSILGGQSKGIPAKRVEDVMALQLLEAGEDIGDGVDAQMAQVQGARRVGEHGHDVGLFLRAPTHIWQARLLRAPEGLPFRREGMQPLLRLRRGSFQVPPSAGGGGGERALQAWRASWEAPGALVANAMQSVWEHHLWATQGISRSAAGVRARRHGKKTALGSLRHLRCNCARLLRISQASSYPHTAPMALSSLRLR